MKYDLFLFDADDTLFDFEKSEKDSFRMTMEEFGIENKEDLIFETYKKESAHLWRSLEQGKVSKDFLRVERFRRTLVFHQIESCPKKMSETYLGILPEQVNLESYATQICEYLSEKTQVGIVTNGIESVQKRRLEKSGLEKYISFMVVSEKCGFVKPDPRFFEYTFSLIEGASKDKTLVIGDRIETDIVGAHAFGLNACWYNPKNTDLKIDVNPKYQISHLSELKEIAVQ